MYSILSILASSASHNLKFRNNIESIPTTNLTAIIIKKLCSESDNKKCITTVYYYCYRFYLDKVECLIGAQKTINITASVVSMVDKIMANIIRSKCTNKVFSNNQRYDYTLIKFSVGK